LQYENENAYVTGHSLGGFLAQVVSYEMIEAELHKLYLPFTSNRSKLKNTLADDKYFKRGVTFNAAPVFVTGYDNLNIPNYFPAIPYNKIISNQYDDLVINYSIEGDFLQSWFVDKAVATKFGKIVSPFSHLNSSESSHALIQFYNHFPSYDNQR